MDWARPCWPGHTVEAAAFCSTLEAQEVVLAALRRATLARLPQTAHCYQNGHFLANEKKLSGPNMTLRFIWIVCCSSEQHRSEVNYMPKDTSNVPFIFSVIDSHVAQIPCGGFAEGLTHSAIMMTSSHIKQPLDARQMTGCLLALRAAHSAAVTMDY